MTAAFKSSALSRNSRAVFEAAESQPVRVTRRDGEDLVLMSAHEADQRSNLLSLAASLISVTTNDHGTLAERMSDAFPWMLALSVADRDTCAIDLIDAARASFATDQPHLAAATLVSWRETATAIAAGLGAAPVEWFDDDAAGIVERP